MMKQLAEIASPSDSLHPLEIKVLRALKDATEPVSDVGLAEACSMEASRVSMAVGWLLTKAFIKVERETRTPLVSLTECGEGYFQDKTPFEWILETIRETCEQGNRVTVQELESRSTFQRSELSRAIGLFKKEGTVRLAPGGYVEVTGMESSLTQSLRLLLEQLHDTSCEFQSFSEPLQHLIRQYAVKRGSTQEPFRIDERISRTYTLTPEGKTVSAAGLPDTMEEISQLSPDMLQDGSWRGKRFRKYTISLRPPRSLVGRRHPYREFLDLVKRKLVGMGFKEMQGPLVETEFWNMDALFMPQFHPARAIHDVYFVKNPTHAEKLPASLLSQVAAAHGHGGSSGSRGWRYNYDMNRARRLVLRSQGTAVSARTLANNPEIPGKYFSIARCFRYDQVDATHATDFIQVEGIVLGSDINFRTLLGLLNLFAKEMAQAKEIRFLPAYFPFTEPSVELHVRHPNLGWMELGGAGLFRPEVTKPLGVTVPVIAWGLGLDRMAMVALGIHDIRDLFTSDLEKVRNMRGRF